MHPEIPHNLLAIVTATITSFAFAWLWYGPIFGKIWTKWMSLKGKMKPKTMIISMALGILGTFLTAHVMYYMTNIWRSSLWGVGGDLEWYMYGFFSGFYTWLGFYLPMGLSSVAWEGRSWKLFGLNMAYAFINLQIIAMILAHMYSAGPQS